jgi:class 3 adenylate cyclase
MSILIDIQNEVKTIFQTNWQEREGTIVPETENVKLVNDAVSIKGTVLYADLAESTDLVMSYKNWFVAEIYKSYLVTACRLIKFNEGIITAFDGDRVMAVFIGNSKNSNAAKTALMINYFVKNVVNNAIKERYPNTGYQIKQAVGIDTSDLYVARAGIRGSNDLVWTCGKLCCEIMFVT